MTNNILLKGDFDKAMVTKLLIIIHARQGGFIWVIYFKPGWVKKTIEFSTICSILYGVTMDTLTKYQTFFTRSGLKIY